MGSSVPRLLMFSIGWRTAIRFPTGAGLTVSMGRVFDVQEKRPMESAGLEQAVAFARTNGQVAIWDRGERPYTVGLYEPDRQEVRPLNDEEAAIVLNRDPLI